MKEFNIWLRYTKNSFQQSLTNRGAFLLLLIGKIIRVGLFLIFLNFLFQGTKDIAGYSKEQVIFFYLTFNLVDTLSQLLFREVYRFRELVISGNLDYVLFKPVNPLVRVLLGGADVMDLIMLILIFTATLWYGASFINHEPIMWIIYLLLIFNGLILSTAFHIFVLGTGILSTSVDHLIMVYRDISNMLRIPVDLYIDPIRFLLTFIIPLGIMLTFPAKMLMGLLTPDLIFISFLFAIVLLFLANKFWKYALKFYQGASS